ncbi:serine/threonine-protein kinase [Streptomyces sp. NPDC047880]|uniref:serine/threonine-protein kinase n=1 Tax=Streptomyces sp. NPDC047880 TaxID=3155626 RepID=UPI003454E7A1
MQGLLVAGRYRLAESIGSGGMGRVWRAHDEVLHRSVAIKELTAALYVSESEQSILLARTRAEARAAARINHSAVVTVHDVLEHDGRPWIVMELVEGRSLADAVKEEGRVEPREAARIGLWVLRALRAAHIAGVLHRDIKPGNVLLSSDRRVLLTDFGIAQIEGDTTITRTGEVVGSVDYLAPERVRGHDPGPSSDLWALGATLYTAVEGRSPFRRTTPLTTMQAVVEEEAAELRHAGPLEPVITALLRKDPAARPDASEAEHMLAEAAEGRRPNGAQAYVPTQYGGTAPYRDHHSGTGTGTAATGTGTTGTGTTASGPFASGSGSHPGTPLPPPAGTAAGGTSPAGTRPYGQNGAGRGATGPQPTGSGRRRRLRTLALVVALAAIIGGGTAVVLQQWNSPSQGDGSGSTTSTSTHAAGGSVPDSWVRYEDPVGFSLYLPKGWKRKPFGPQGEIKQIDYSPDGGLHFVRIAIDTSPDFADAKSHQEDLEQQVQRLVDYKRVTMEENTYRDREGSLWEYTWTALAKDPPYVAGPRHAMEETYFSRDGVEYAIYISSPEKDWAQTNKQFKWVLQGWQQPRQVG